MGVTSPQDNNQAVAWIRKAAEQGDASAQYNLGQMYARGQGVPQDYVQAYKWIFLADERGGASAAKSRAVLASDMTLSQIAEAKRLASEWRSAFEQQRETQ